MMHSYFSFPRRLLWAALLAVPLVTPPPDAHGQRVTDQTDSEREELYREIDLAVAVLERQTSVLKKVVRLVKPTVVHIEAEKGTQSVRYGGKQVEEAGSGVILKIDKKFYVVTNRHVVKNSPLRGITLRLADGRVTHPTRLWSDRTTDIAVLAIGETRLVPARLGDSKQIDIGDFVLAVGSPFGLSHSVTYGIVSAKGRRDLELGDGSIRYQDFIQTDAAINPGNSGGPLMNLRGEVIGINTAIASSSGGSEGIGFAIPINMVVKVARQLVRDGRTQRAYLGVNLNPEFGPRDAKRLGLENARGAHIKSVTPGSPAARAAFQTDDVVIEFDGTRIEDDDHLIQAVGFTDVGQTVKVRVFRDGQVMTLDVVLAKRNQFEADG